MIYDFTKIGQRVRQNRELLPKGKRSQEKFAEIIGISKPTLCKIENGDYGRDIDNGVAPKFFPALLKMCEVFNCEIGYLLCEYDEKTRVDTDIHNYTGLNTFAITELNFLRRHYDENDYTKLYLDLLNALISYGDFMALIEDIIEIRNIENSYYIKGGKDEYNQDYEKGLRHFETIEKEIRYYEFCAFEEFKSGIYSILDNETAIDIKKKSKGGDKHGNHNKTE